MATTVLAPAKAKDLSSYAVLRTRVRETLLEGQKKIEEQKVLTYWNTGKHIAEHIRLNGDTTEYGQRVFENLSKDVDLHISVIQKITQFYRAFSSTAARLALRLNLTWSHFRILIRISDEEKRLEYARLAHKKEWSSRDLEVEVRNHNWYQRISKSEEKEPTQLPPVILGPFHTYKIIRPKTIHEEESGLVLDMGFSMKNEMSNFPGVRYGANTIITSIRDSKGRYSVIKAENATEDILYTYKAYVENVIDGDTLKLDFRVGFGYRRGETIRLNHIDCPELDTSEGIAAKKFVESQLSGCDFITVKSVRTRKEKWGRYLGDVFFQKPGADTPVYLNQLLLDKGHAVRVRM